MYFHARVAVTNWVSKTKKKNRVPYKFTAAIVITIARRRIPRCSFMSGPAPGRRFHPRFLFGPLSGLLGTYSLTCFMAVTTFPHNLRWYSMGRSQAFFCNCRILCIYIYLYMHIFCLPASRRAPKSLKYSRGHRRREEILFCILYRWEKWLSNFCS